jgi:hypothetical protein
MPSSVAATRKRYMVVVKVFDDLDGRETGRVGRSVDRTAAAQTAVIDYLVTQGIPKSAYVMAPPSSVGTFGMETTDAVAKLVRNAPHVEAVLEG